MKILKEIFYCLLGKVDSIHLLNKEIHLFKYTLHLWFSIEPVEFVLIPKLYKKDHGLELRLDLPIAYVFIGIYKHTKDW